MLDHAWNTEARWMDLMIALLDVFEQAKMEEKSREENDDVAETGSIAILTPQTPGTPFTPYSDKQTIFPIAPHGIFNCSNTCSYVLF